MIRWGYYAGLEPVEREARVYVCPACGAEVCEVVYTRLGEIIGCDQCMRAQPPEEVLLCDEE